MKKLLLIALLIVGCEDESKAPFVAPEPEPYQWYCKADDWNDMNDMCGLPEIVDDSLYDGLWDTQVNCEETGCEVLVVGL